MVVDRHPLPERPVARDLAELVGVIGVAVRAPVLTRHDGGDHLPLAGAEPAAPVGAQQGQKVAVEPLEIALVQREGAKPVGGQSLFALLASEEAPHPGSRELVEFGYPESGDAVGSQGAVFSRGVGGGGHATTMR